MREKWRHDRETSNNFIETCFCKNLLLLLIISKNCIWSVTLLISCLYPSYLTFNYTLYKNPGFWLVNSRCIFHVFSYLGLISFILTAARVFAWGFNFFTLVCIKPPNSFVIFLLYLYTMLVTDQNGMSNSHRGPSIDASYHVSVHLAKLLQSRRFFRTWPIRNNNCLWRRCLLMDRDKMSNLYREPSIDASYQVSVYLAKWFQRRTFLEIGQLETRIACGGHVC